ncbi:hypothetical protein RUMHYD_02723 [Blautia hydrogenotrophica DSM 10507]|uniref:Uncharacterized protein n=1 Tax=Blautia hydrogenotrophica (strain DSM 10507 / JCM 14656 / S5a33) TaxID=476272 RepID=C0CPC2_BLAHS|nr:hypothetical protein RUMHYD_02723 [Blautia hydrogenotrophica DSM 10507]
MLNHRKSSDQEWKRRFAVKSRLFRLEKSCYNNQGKTASR